MKRGFPANAVMGAALLFFQAAWLSAQEPTLREFRHPEMGTMFTIRMYAADEKAAQAAADKAFSRAKELNQIFSDYIAESEVIQFCLKPPGTRVKLSPDLAAILKLSQDVAANSDGAFDVTIGPMVRLWRQTRRDSRLPTASQLETAFARTGFRKLTLFEDGSAQLAVEMMRIDLGGVAKGYAADELLKVLKNAGFPQALVAASGDIAFGDAPPGADGWKVGITSILSPDQPDRFLLLHHAAVSTSGDTLQFVEIDGKRYSHIVDPKTGLGLTERKSVTVIAPSCTLTDALATALSVSPRPAEVLTHYPEVRVRIVREAAGKEELLGGFEKLPVAK